MSQYTITVHYVDNAEESTKTIESSEDKVLENCNSIFQDPNTHWVKAVGPNNWWTARLKFVSSNI